jgi:hypothetical protein
MTEVIRQVEEASERAGRIHGLAQIAMTGALARTLDTSNPTKPASGTKLRNELSQVVYDTHEMIAGNTFRVERELVRQAYDDAGADFQPLDGEPDGTTFSENLMVTLGTDMTHVEKTWKRFALNVQLAQSMGLSETQAIIRHKYGQLSSIKFTRPDRAGKRWVSGTYSQNLVRGYLLSSYVVSYLHALTLRGIDTAVVAGLDEGHRHAGLRFSITGKTVGLPTFESIRDEVWHPNSNAIVSQD